MARLIGISQPSVWKWVQAGKHLPAEHVRKVEQSTGISKHLLRPDIFGEIAVEARDVDCDTRKLSQRSYEA